jgi:DNA-binding NarL/FixJ family response regulator
VTFVERLIEAARHYHNLEPDLVGEDRPTRLYEQLTPREREILQLLAKGYSTRKIAEQLTISVNTTRNHIQHLLQKLNVHSRLEAVITGIKWDLVDDKD